MSSEWQVSRFEYPNVMGGADDRADTKDGQMWPIEVDPRQKQEKALREAQAREIGRVEGEAKAKVQGEDLLRKERERIAESLRQFGEDRARYFGEIEGEVVQLALAIARKVLHREAQIDPELLMGLVRYTLEKLRNGTKVKLRVSPARAGTWQQELTGDDIEVVADSKVELGMCVVETELGTTAVNVDAQLKEIEQGLMDLLAHRPETR